MSTRDRQAAARFLTPRAAAAGDLIHRARCRRRGQVQDQDTRGNAVAIEAMVPLANMFGYVNQLRSFTQGRAQYTMQFSHYEEVPQSVADEVKAKLA